MVGGALYRSCTRNWGRLVVVVAVSGWVCACRGGTDGRESGTGASTPAVTVRDSAGVELVTIESAAAALPEWGLDTVLVAIDGSSPHLSFILDALWLSDERIVVPDLGARVLHVYDPSGAYQRSLGGDGDGPGEFRRIGAVTAGAGDTISVFDATDGAGGSIQLYDPDEGFLESIPLPSPDGEGARRQGWHWGAAGYVGLAERREPMARVAPDLHFRATISVLERLGNGARADAAVRFPGSYSGFHDSGMDVRLPFSHRPVVLVGPDRLLYGAGQRFEILELDRSFTLRRILRWPSLQEPLDDEDLEQARSEWLAPREGTVDPEPLQAILEPEVLPEERPAIGKALFDDEGRIWVARFEPFVFVERLYYVLEPDGEPVARLRIPAEKRALLSGVRGDRVLLAGKDALDVPRIEVVRIRKP